jgi:CIC family chloride channel protein
MLSGVTVAAALAAVVEHSILGSNPVLLVQANYTLTNSLSLVWFALLGLLAIVVSVAFTNSLLGLRAWFRRLTGVPSWVHPVIGGATRQI